MSDGGSAAPLEVGYFLLVKCSQPRTKIKNVPFVQYLGRSRSGKVDVFAVFVGIVSFRHGVWRRVVARPGFREGRV